MRNKADQSTLKSERAVTLKYPRKEACGYKPTETEQRDYSAIRSTLLRNRFIPPAVFATSLRHYAIAVHSGPRELITDDQCTVGWATVCPKNVGEHRPNLCSGTVSKVLGLVFVPAAGQLAGAWQRLGCGASRGAR